MGWRGGWRGRGGWFGPWPGRGPFSYLPPWQRPGWLFGRGACWRLFGAPFWYWYGAAPYTGIGYPPYVGYGPYTAYPPTPPWAYPPVYPRQPFRTGSTEQTTPYGYQATPSLQTPYVQTPEEEWAMLEKARVKLERDLKGTEARIKDLKFIKGREEQ